MQGRHARWLQQSSLVRDSAINTTPSPACVGSPPQLPPHLQDHGWHAVAERIVARQVLHKGRLAGAAVCEVADADHGAGQAQGAQHALAVEEVARAVVGGVQRGQQAQRRGEQVLARGWERPAGGKGSRRQRRRRVGGVPRGGRSHPDRTQAPPALRMAALEARRSSSHKATGRSAAGAAGCAPWGERASLECAVIDLLDLLHALPQAPGQPLQRARTPSRRHWLRGQDDDRMAWTPMRPADGRLALGWPSVARRRQRRHLVRPGCDKPDRKAGEPMPVGL